MFGKTSIYFCLKDKIKGRIGACCRCIGMLESQRRILRTAGVAIPKVELQPRKNSEVLHRYWSKKMKKEARTLTGEQDRMFASASAKKESAGRDLH
jgi:hypothetical protein